MAAPKVSAVVPVFNERENVEAMHAELKAALDREFPDHEILYVDDGSTDGSTELLTAICDRDSKTRLVSFRRNFGQTAALSAGFQRAKGDVVVALDADRQNDPADIRTLVDEVTSGCDVASGWRSRRQDDGLTRRLPSAIANALISCVTGVRLHDSGCTLKAYRRDVLDGVRLYGEMHRFIPAILSYRGARIKEVAVNHRPRAAGRGKYGLGRTIRVLFDLMTVKFLGTYATKPMHFFGAVAFFFWLLSLAVLAGFVSVGCCFSWRRAIDSFLWLPALPLFVFGLLMLGLGLLAELVARGYHDTRRDDVYTIRFTRNF